MKNNNFTEKEIKVLKEIANERIMFNLMFFGDKCAKYEYRNRFEDYKDAYANLKALGFSDEEILKRIGRKK